ncbi:hypothetical protein [Marinomonas colpomeniae]|uniref:Uncharacterized protein n=1 Tax=Marinomonas colpomeniae TaxID=2774408 RepID=A0ABR8P1G5_9GAMM|nr:hypothetical protein [Marinomonas colpomeniae]MBD5772133.1 hypothetical protein [Marinomonas colpomeniae]
MKKLTSKIIGISSFTLLLSGCSSLYTDHSNDYQDEKPVENSLKAPANSTSSNDRLVIPNENTIADLESSKPFVTPRAKFIFYPMVAVGITEKDNAIEFSIPANVSQSKHIIVDFLSALYGAGESISSQTESLITSVPFEFHPQGSLASLWSSITRVYPARTAFSFEFTVIEGSTLVSVQFREEQKDSEPSDWMSPIKNEDAYSTAIRLWGTIGRKLNESSAYLSNIDDTPDSPIWINHSGLYSIHLGNNVSLAEIDAKLNAAGMYVMEGSENVLAPVPQEEVARIGDVVDFSIPIANGEKQKLFSVRRRDLDDVSWDKREYSYEITQQKAGDFLYIDVSKMEYPEVVSFHLIQRFVN